MESLAKPPPDDEGPEVRPPDDPSRDSGDAAGRVAGVGDRVQEILDDAERAADEIRTEAQAASAAYLAERRREADRLVEERLERLGELTEALSARAAGVEREASVLAAEVADAIGRLKGADGDGGSIAAIASPQAASAADLPEQAVLRATQMAVTGADRAEIEQALKKEFEIDDPEPIVDQVLASRRA